MTRRHTFEVKSNTFFDFAPITESQTLHLAPMVYKLGRAFSARVPPGKYGTGVKDVVAGVILTDPQGLGRGDQVTRPRYRAGVRTLKAHGLAITVENVLEFDIRPSFEAVCRAHTEADIAGVLLSALDQPKSALEKLKIPDFNKALFLSDLEHFLERAAAGGLQTH